MICLLVNCERVLNQNNKSGYCTSHPESKAIRQARWRERNPEVARAARLTYVASHQDDVAKSKRAHREGNRDRYRELDQIRYERVRGTLKRQEQNIRSNANRRARNNCLFVETVDRRIVFERDDGVCHICSSLVDPLEWELEHIVPQSKGGTHEYLNVAVSHPECNNRKGKAILSANVVKLADALEAYMRFHEGREVRV